LFGTPEKFAEKLNRLKKFDKQVLAKAGLNKYSRLDLRYDKQIVATLRGQEDLPPPQINITPDVEIAATPPPTLPAEPAHEIVKADVKPPERKQEARPEARTVTKPIASLKKAPAKQETAKTEAKKTEKKPEKNRTAVVKKKPADSDKKIVAASSNKTNKNTLKQLPKNVDKPGIIEVDIRKKSDNKKSEPRAVMPKKQ
jgi:hypothetical protein